MARYQVNDIVLVEGNNDNQYTARVIEMIFDGHEDDVSEYLVIDDFEDEHEVTDEQIVERISRAVPQNQAFIRGLNFDTPNTNPVGPDEPFGNFTAVGLDEVRATPIQGLDNAPQPTITYRMNNVDFTREMQMMWGNVRERANPHEPVDITDTADRMINARMATNLADRINQDVDNGIPATRAEVVNQPILPNEGRPTQPCNAADHRVGIADYNPQVGDTRSLMSFRMTVGLNGFVFTPMLVDGEYIFISETTGMRWVSQYQDGNVRHLPHFSDENGVYWCDAETVRTSIASDFSTRLRNIISKSKKKLYRKHPIPEIKDEKHYATKEFIA